jgi:hypothetical protein
MIFFSFVKPKAAVFQGATREESVLFRIPRACGSRNNPSPASPWKIVIRVSSPVEELKKECRIVLCFLPWKAVHPSRASGRTVRMSSGRFLQSASPDWRKPVLLCVLCELERPKGAGVRSICVLRRLFHPRRKAVYSSRASGRAVRMSSGRFLQSASLPVRGFTGISDRLEETNSPLRTPWARATEGSGREIPFGRFYSIFW